ncbi:MAG: hypothetical protein JO035_07915 [Betaproteobacteria bacterium]|nr:hypothetical protein [Betaproteobacteria bacterium]
MSRIPPLVLSLLLAALGDAAVALILLPSATNSVAADLAADEALRRR